MIEEITNFDPADYLETNADRAQFLSEAMETNDGAYIVRVLDIIVRSIDKGDSRGGSNHRTDYAALREQTVPSLETALLVIKALGLKLTAHPL